MVLVWSLYIFGGKLEEKHLFAFCCFTILQSTIIIISGAGVIHYHAVGRTWAEQTGLADVRGGGVGNVTVPVGLGNTN